MTSSTPDTTAASNSGTITSAPAPPDHGVMALRDIEAKGLIALACEANHETTRLAHDLHDAIYGGDGPSERAEALLDETLTCLQTAEHYLLMLGSVFEQRTKNPGSQGPTGTAL